MATYQEIRRQVENLSVDEQLKLMEELAKMLDDRQSSQPKHSIMELEGLGKDIWQGIDAQKYVDRERQSWDGYTNLRS